MLIFILTWVFVGLTLSIVDIAGATHACDPIKGVSDEKEDTNYDKKADECIYLLGWFEHLTSAFFFCELTLRWPCYRATFGNWGTFLKDNFNKLDVAIVLIDLGMYYLATLGGNAGADRVDRAQRPHAPLVAPAARRARRTRDRPARAEEDGRGPGGVDPARALLADARLPDADDAPDGQHPAHGHQPQARPLHHVPARHVQGVAPRAGARGADTARHLPRRDREELGPLAQQRPQVRYAVRGGLPRHLPVQARGARAERARRLDAPPLDASPAARGPAADAAPHG